MERNDGGPAFPIIDVNQSWDSDSQSYNGVRTDISSAGMTLRDYFAAKALADIAGRFSWEDEDIKKAAELAYRMADAMLGERAK